MAAQGGEASFDNMITQYGGSALSSTSSYGSSSSHQSLVGAYGQRGRVGTEQLVDLLQRQHAVFLQVAARVAETHEYCDRCLLMNTVITFCTVVLTLYACIMCEVCGMCFCSSFAGQEAAMPIHSKRRTGKRPSRTDSNIDEVRLLSIWSMRKCNAC